MWVDDASLDGNMVPGAGVWSSVRGGGGWKSVRGGGGLQDAHPSRAYYDLNEGVPSLLHLRVCVLSASSGKCRTSC